MLQREIDSREFAEWVAFSAMEPFDAWRADALVAQLRATVWDAVCSLAAGMVGKKHTPSEPSAFLPRWDAEARERAGRERFLGKWRRFGRGRG